MTWNKVTTTINNLILGKIYVEHCGTMRVQSADLPTEVRVKFKDGGVFSGSKRAVTGRLHEGGRDLHSHKCALLATGIASLQLQHRRVAAMVSRPE